MYYKDEKDRTFIKIDNSNDLWYVWNIIEVGDIIEAYDFRAVEQINEKKKVRLKIQIEKIKYMKDIKSVRVTGKIIEGSPLEYIQLGKYHSFDISKGFEFYIYKQWTSYQRELLEESYKSSKELVAQLIMIDERRLQIYKIYPIGLELIIDKDLPYSKQDNENREEIYKEIIKHLSSKNIIIAGPGFEKEKLKDYLKDYNIIGVFNISYVEISSLKELIPQIAQSIKNYRLNKDREIAEIIEIYISKYNEMVVIGEEVYNYVEGALEYLIVLDELLENNNIRELLKKANNYKTKIHIISSDSPYSERFKLIKLLGIRRY